MAKAKKPIAQTPEPEPEVQGGDDWTFDRKQQGWKQCQHCKAYSKGARSLTCKNPDCGEPFPQKQTRQTSTASGQNGVVSILMRRIAEIDSILDVLKNVNPEDLETERDKLQETLSIYGVDEDEA